MRTIRRIPAIILLSLSLAEVSSGLSVSSSSLGMSNPLLQVEHPLIYRPMSLASPGAPPYVPSDIRIAYDFTPLYAHSINGSSTRIAIIDAYGDSKLSSDLSSFDSLTGLTPGRLNTYYPDGTPTQKNSGWALETALDVEWAHAIAPGAIIDLVISPDSGLGHMFDAMSYVANNLTNETVLSMSFGLSESQYPTTGGATIAQMHQLFVTMTSHGTTPFASSGDNGASSCCDVSYPASDPLVVAVGGTTLNLNSSAGYVSETAWSGSGAGSSTIFAKPTWQQNLPGTMRELTDVSYNADPNTGVLVVQNGLQYEVGGTSASSPQIAALIALASEVSGVRYGSIGSKLYSLTSYNDITNGSNGLFSANSGWDYPTGLGTPDASQLIGTLTGLTVPIQSNSLFQGLNFATTGNIQVNRFSSTLSGTATVEAINATTGQLVYEKNYTFSSVRTENMSMIETAHFLLRIPVDPYPLSADIRLTVQGTATTVQVEVTRAANISGGGTVNIEDVGFVLAEYNMVQGTAGYDPRADLAAAGIVNVTDLSIVDLYFNSPVFY